MDVYVLYGRCGPEHSEPFAAFSTLGAAQAYATALAAEHRSPLADALRRTNPTGWLAEGGTDPVWSIPYGWEDLCICRLRVDAEPD